MKNSIIDECAGELKGAQIPPGSLSEVHRLNPEADIARLRRALAKCSGLLLGAAVFLGDDALEDDARVFLSIVADS